jgi:glycine/D-amino acid oxidase-like deaminating enzyme
MRYTHTRRAWESERMSSIVPEGNASGSHESVRLSYSSAESLASRAAIHDLLDAWPGSREERERSLGLFVRGSLLARIVATGEIYKAIVGIPGAIFDVGTWRGQTAVLCENFRAIYEPLNLNRRIVAFDTFEGYAGFGAEDTATDLHRDGTYRVGGDYRAYLDRLLRLHEESNVLGHNNGKHTLVVVRDAQERTRGARLSRRQRGGADARRGRNDLAAPRSGRDARRLAADAQQRPGRRLRLPDVDPRHAAAHAHVRTNVSGSRDHSENRPVKVVVAGNGVIGLQAARIVRERIPEATVTIVGPSARPGSASLAAAAMLNSFCEVEAGMLENRFERAKFALNRAAVPLWPATLERVRAESGLPVNAGFGTYVLNNATSDLLEDENFDAIRAALVDAGEPFDDVVPRDIPFYKPAARSRAVRALFIPGEGWVNPVQFLAALDAILMRDARVERVDDVVDRLVYERGRDAIAALETGSGTRVNGDVFVLAPGANFSAIVDRSALPIAFQRIFYGVGATVRIRTGAQTPSSCIRTPNRGLACGTYVAPQDAEHIVVGASNLISPEPRDHAHVTSVLGLLEAAVDQINRDFYRAAFETVNVGWRPTSTDTLPLLGRSQIGNLIVATGTRRDGFHCSPLIGELIADLVAGREPAFDLSTFVPDRPVTRTHTRAEAVEALVRHTINAHYQHGYQPARSQMNDELVASLRERFERLHDTAGAHDWGIPLAMADMYRYGNIPA